ncbi:MAG: hypothetical protein EXX96DRAFT_571789 [Benjaminiella poitrasii]|nr:MAG: hypothetical protein EXX96DRAFT_571789 [Benjaminiella poitrasii]
MEQPHFNNLLDRSSNTMENSLSIFPLHFENGIIDNSIATEVSKDYTVEENTIACSATAVITDNSVLSDDSVFYNEMSSVQSSPLFYKPYSTNVYSDQLVSPASYFTATPSPYEFNDAPMVDYFTLDPTCLRNNTYQFNSTNEFQYQVYQQTVLFSDFPQEQTLPICLPEYRLKYEQFDDTGNINQIDLTPVDDKDGNNKDNESDSNKPKLEEGSTSPPRQRVSVSKDSNTTTMTTKKPVRQEKVFPCTYCTSTFSRKYDVIRHKRIHTGDKPYECPCCSKRFSRSDGRTRHFRTERSCQHGPEKLTIRRRRKLQ